MFECLCSNGRAYSNTASNATGNNASSNADGRESRVNSRVRLIIEMPVYKGSPFPLRKGRLLDRNMGYGTLVLPLDPYYIY